MAVICRLCRGFRLAALLAICFAAPLGSQAADLAPVGDRAAALAEARRHGKLLLVVNHSGSFLASDAKSPEARLYRTLALSDSRVARLVADRFVVRFCSVGQTPSLQLVDDAKDPRAATKEYALAFICTPSGRVLHLIPGLVSADELLRELEWADALNAERLRSPPAGQEWFIRERHLAAAPWALQRFRDAYGSKWREGFQAPGSQMHNDLIDAMQAACKVRDESLLNRWKANWPAVADQQLLTSALASHGGLEPTLAHLLLAEFPLPRLHELEQPLYEIASGQRYWRAPPSGPDLMCWWNEVRRMGSRSLVIVNDDPFFTPQVKGGDALAWPPLAPQIAADLRQFATKVITLDELAVLMTNARLEPIRFRADEGPPRFLIYYAGGFRAGKMSASEGTIIRLHKALHAIVSPGDVVAAAGAGGGKKNERDRNAN